MYLFIFFKKLTFRKLKMCKAHIKLRHKMHMYDKLTFKYFIDIKLFQNAKTSNKVFVIFLYGYSGRLFFNKL